MIPVLFTQKHSNYLSSGCFDCWDIKRNAFNYQGSSPIISHPPCRLFGRLRKFSTAPACEMLMAYWSVAYVRNHGGIVEHPRSSTLWNKMKVGSPGHLDKYGGFLISVDLSWFGYPARKKTGLYIVGLPYKLIPALPLSFNAIEFTVSRSKVVNLPEIQKSKRSETPIELISWLKIVIELIEFR